MDKLKAAAANRNRAAVLIAAALLAVCAGWALIQPNAEKEANAYADSLSHDTALLLEWADQIYAGGACNAEWTVRFDVTDETSRLTLEKILGLLIRNNGAKTDNLYAGEGDSVTVSVLDGTAELSIHALPEPEEGEASRFLVLLRTVAAGNVDGEAFKDAVEQAAVGFREQGVSYTGTVSARGSSGEKRAADKAAALAQAREVERYEDNGTESVVYYASKLQSYVKVGEGRAANLQIARYQRTDNGEWSIIVGVPLITGDYSTVEAP